MKKINVETGNIPKAIELIQYAVFTLFLLEIGIKDTNKKNEEHRDVKKKKSKHKNQISLPTLQTVVSVERKIICWAVL